MPKKILIVNDELDIAEVTKDMLELEGYEPLVVESAEAAIEHFKAELPDLLLLDLLLAGMQGEELCKRLKSESRTKDLPVILFSANDVDLERVAKEAGADGWVMIPYDPDELIGKIKNLIG